MQNTQTYHVPANKLSRINKDLPLSHDIWVVSLLRRKQSRNPRHTFLLIEGINQFGQGTVRRYDLVIKKESENKAEIIDRIEDNLDLTDMDRAVEFLTVFGGDNDKLFAKSWQISRQQVLQLHQAIQTDKGQTIFYNSWGEKSISAVSQEGMNCFDWARKKLNDLNDPGIQVPELLTDYVATDPALYLEPSSRNCLVM